MNKLIILSIILLLSISCKKEAVTIADVSGIDVAVTIDRFDKKFYKANETNLSIVKSEYPYLFPSQNHDSIWLNRINDKNEQFLFEEAQKIFNNFEVEKSQITDLFKHVKYYHPTFKEPKMITLISNVDYESNVIYADSLLLVSLDMYLGKNNEIYRDFPAYLSKNFEKSQLVVDIANAVSEYFYVPSSNRQFIDLIINEGKKKYLVDSYLPTLSDAQKMGYTKSEIEWVERNEAQIWKYFIENQLLYSTDASLKSRFIDIAPFSKFFIDIDKESPGRVGVWLGWQIVHAYMNNNNVTLQQLLITNAEDIFKKSKYKPKK